MNAVEDAGLHHKTSGALLDAGYLYAADLAELLSDVSDRASATVELRRIKGVGDQGAHAVVSWLRDVGAWPRTRGVSTTTVARSPDEHPDVAAWRAELATRFPSSTVGQDFDLGAAVYQAYEDGRIPAIKIGLSATRARQSRRTYLGASGLGAECPRQVWAGYRGLDDAPEGRLVRLFASGDIYEERMHAELQALGFTISGDQSSFAGMGDRVRGHTDGFVRLGTNPPWALWEAKSANSRKFADLYKLAVSEPVDNPLKAWNLKYYTQVQIYMGAFGLNVALFEVSCKDNDKILALLVPRDDEAIADAGERARLILDGEGVAPRGYTRPRTPECTRFCEHVEWCWFGASLPKSCGSCVHWRDHTCALTGADATQVCERYEPHIVTDNTLDEWESL